MVTIKNSWRAIAAALGVATFCIPTDLGVELPAPGIHTAVDAEFGRVVRCEAAQSLRDDGERPAVARLAFTERGRRDGSGKRTGSATKSDTVVAEQADPRSKQLGDVPATLPASAAPSILPKPLVAAQTVVSAGTIRALQRELKRHGCYTGVVDGDWGPASRYAAATFTAAVNASLPIDKPDEFLLALARQTRGRACQQTSNIMTASTTQSWRATITPNGLPDRGTKRPPTSTVSAYAPRLAGPPRVVRANGAQPTIDLTNVPEMPLPPPGEMDQRTQMALGAPASSPSSKPDPVTRDSTSRPQRDATRRAASRNRQRQPRQRASRKSWKRQVYQSINLSGS